MPGHHRLELHARCPSLKSTMPEMVSRLRIVTLEVNEPSRLGSGRPTYTRGAVAQSTGGPPVDCATAPRVYVGRPDPSREGSFTSSVTIRNRLTISGMVDFKLGQRAWSSSLWCPGILGCYEKLY